MTPQSRSTHPERLSLRADSESKGYIDAVWWPRSSDIATELPHLLTALQARTGSVWRAVFDPRAWAPAGRKLPMGGRTIRLDPYLFELFGTIYLCGVDGTVIVVQTVPADADATFARAMLATTGGAARSDPDAELPI
ncbi:DUF5994 family protein [Nocardia otitidiscaviarum]|uniref:DUF5994 family protein n=1 Tax=Nocardia otitidiscaviarum TaxID=1823 RepID=UPI0018959DF1|nr:DUF5994 family protein [Nocardia otitidiscaviarum]MBF6181534.1 hypothetical protein [Nocardia otitidiscaviarum]